MDRYFPYRSAALFLTGVLLAWLIGPAIALLVYLSVQSSPWNAANALPFEFFAAGVCIVGWVLVVCGLFRALRTVDFLGRREYARMEDEESYVGG